LRPIAIRCVRSHAEWTAAKQRCERPCHTLISVGAEKTIVGRLQEQCERLLAIDDADNCSAWDLKADGGYVRRRRYLARLRDAPAARR